MNAFFKTIGKYFLPYKRDLILNVVFNFLSALFSIFSLITMIPLLKILFGLDQKVYGYISMNEAFGSLESFGNALKHNVYCLITQVSDNQGPALALVYIGLFMVVMVFFKVTFTYLSTYYITFFRNGVVRDLRSQLFNKTLSLPVGFFSEERKGDIIARITGDVTEVELSAIGATEMLIKSPIIILVSVVTLFIMSWQLTLFVLVLFPAAGYIIGKVGKTLRKKSMAGQNKMGELMSTVEESLSGLKIIKAFVAEKKISERFRKQIEEYRKIMNRLYIRYYLASPLSELLGTILVIIVMWYGGYLILNHTSVLSPEKFLVYLAVFYSVINPSKAFSTEYYHVQKGLAAMERINRIMDAGNPIVEKKDARPIHAFNEAIEYRDVSFRYKTDYVLKGISLKVKKGRMIALVGHSGSGKSTLADLLPRLYDVTSGQIMIDGVDIRDYKISDLRNLMGIVSQDPILFNDTFFNNIAFGVETATAGQVIEAAKIANAHEFIINTENGYDTGIGDRGSKLSGGQRQRISIARAILKNPPILILDEATSALDTESEKLVQDALSHLMQNRTSIVIAHRFSTIIDADEIHVVKNGEIIEKGNHEELMKQNGEYRKIFDMQYFVS
ncbi:MAG: antibiotic transporter ATP-binding protein [Bacteroidetes bacterium]|nr:antibiotic transporter ATP-binding protein [Bacteroidota bacterium]